MRQTRVALFVAMSIVGSALAAAPAVAADSQEASQRLAPIRSSSVVATKDGGRLIVNGKLLGEATGATSGGQAFDEIVDVTGDPGLFVVDAGPTATIQVPVKKMSQSPARASSATTASTSTPLEVDLSYTTTEKSVNLYWTDVPDRTTVYTVTRDGQLLGTTTNPYMRDTAGTPGRFYEYAVSVSRPYSPPPAVASTDAPSSDPLTLPGDEPEPSIVTPTPPARVAGEDDPVADDQGLTMAVQAARLGGFIGTPDAYEASTTSATASIVRTYARHTTFIANARETVDVPFFCGVAPGNAYGGDGRGFSATSNAYRTRYNITMNWETGKLSSSKSVHDTYKYFRDGRTEKRNAGTGGMSIKTYNQSTSKTQFYVTHSVKNPFCSGLAGAITYHWQGTLYRSGSYAVVGGHRKAPHHEIYIGRIRSGQSPIPWSTVYQRKAESFKCLVRGACGEFTIYKEGVI